MANLYVQAGHPDLAEREYLEHINYPNKLQEHPHDFYKEDWKQRRKREYMQSCIYLGKLELMLDKIDNAEALFVESFRYSKNNLDGLRGLAEVYKARQDKENYKKIYKMLKRRYPRDPYVQRMSPNI